MAPAATLRRIRPLAHKAGVTRLADITGLDRVGIATWSAVVPKSRDLLSVYNGKGATATDAACGALMEAIERHSALEYRPACTIGSFAKLRKKHRLLDPRTITVQPDSEYTGRTPLSWVAGHDLISHETVLVPAKAAGYLLGDDFGVPCFDVITSNGLASGNTIEEAVCHALCEVIERDAWTLADLLAHWLPLWKHEQQPRPDAFRDDTERFPEIDLAGAAPQIQRMMRRFAREGLAAIVKDVTSDIGVPTVMAATAEDGPVPLAHLGFGTHPDPEVAIVRALSELAQSRVVDIQGVREDISNPDEDVPSYMHHVKRVSAIDRNCWFYARTSWRRRPDEMGGAVNGDILDDIDFMLRRLQASGLREVVVVDLTHRDLGVPVVRVLVPGLESWSADHSRIGWRATAAWQANER
jgi:ribosomal protein S12 methylthiotransferase accessory factor